MIVVQTFVQKVLVQNFRVQDLVGKAPRERTVEATAIVVEIVVDVTILHAMSVEIVVIRAEEVATFLAWVVEH